MLRWLASKFGQGLARYLNKPKREYQAFDVTDPARLASVHRVRHHTLFTPRDFDISPYFRIIKPTLESGFDHQRLTWAENRSDPDTV